jgi:glycerophosphoryl diester phosphodiesterase
LNPLVVAHRGAWGIARENTLAAFEAAVRLGADLVEFDVWRCDSGELLVLHDGVIQGRSIRSLTYREAVELTGQPIPRLEEVLELTRGRIGIDLELKDSECVAEVAELVREQALPGVVLLSSFSVRAVGELRDMDPKVQLALIWARPLGRGGESELIHTASSMGVTHLALHHRLMREQLLAHARDAGLGLLPWTVNGPRALRRCLGSDGVWGVVTDRSELALQLRRRLQLGQGVSSFAGESPEGPPPPAD